MRTSLGLHDFKPVQLVKVHPYCRLFAVFVENRQLHKPVRVFQPVLVFIIFILAMRVRTRVLTMKIEPVMDSVPEILSCYRATASQRVVKSTFILREATSKPYCHFCISFLRWLFGTAISSIQRGKVPYSVDRR